MKITSKSILSPGHAVRDPPVSLSTSLSRRLRTNRSLKGGQSPMFPTAAKKRGGAAFDNPEPSSPKVTCIGQVRVKTKKQGKKLRTRRAGEVSFRRIEQNANQSTQPPQDCLRQRNQKWVHLPLTICEALRAFGAEFSCLFPCRSSCFSTGERRKEEKPAGGGEQQSSCGAVFARWLVAVEGGKGGREIELVVGGEEERLEMESRERASRRHGDFVVEGEIGAVKGESFEVKNGVLEEEEEEGRVSICVPPKNALLLMRCRSDPNRISALASRFWESTALQVEQEEDDEQEEEDEDDEEGHEDGTVDQAQSRLMEDKEVEMAEKLVGSETSEEEQDSPKAEAEEKENPEAEKLEISGELVEDEEEEEDDGDDGEEESQEKEMEEESQENELTQLSGCSSEDFLDPENPEKEEEERRESHHSSSSSVVSEQSDLADENEAEYKEATLEEEEEGDEEDEGKEEKSTEEKETQERPLDEEQEVTVTQERSESEETQKEEESADQPQEREEEGSHGKDERESSSEVLPECLLLMRYEPKLSMEVSKETWVCSTDFVRWLPERRQPAVEKTGGDDNEGKKRASTNSSNAAAPQQPPRSSCSLPATAAASMAAMIEQRLVSAVAYEPFVLTRCKSEPMRTAAAKLAPDTCFWKNRKLEPLRRATLGVGAAGVGF